jgi:hypothetical protein
MGAACVWGGQWGTWLAWLKEAPSHIQRWGASESQQAEVRDEITG